MRNTYSWKQGIIRQLRSQWTDDASISPQACCDVELGIYALLRLLPGEHANALWVLLVGYPFKLPQAAHWSEQERHMRQVLRYLISHYKTYQGWRRAVERYGQLPARLRLYTVEKDGSITSHADKVSIGSNREHIYGQTLSQTVPFARDTVHLASAGRYLCKGGKLTAEVVIPEDLVSSCAYRGTRGHDLQTKQQRPPVNVTFQELLATALWMDEETRKHEIPTASWYVRLKRVQLEMFNESRENLSATSTLSWEGMLHLVGMVSSGKSTLMDVLAVWAARKGLHVTIVVGDVVSALNRAQLFMQLGIRVAPILGASNRERHTNRLHRVLHTEHPLMPLYQDHIGFRWLSTGCALDGLRDSDQVFALGRQPCLSLTAITAAQGDISVDADNGVEEGNKKLYACPLFSSCPYHQAQLDLVDADIWIATPASLIYSRVAFAKAPLESRQGVLGSIQAKDLVWQKVPVDLAQWTTRENGTAAPVRGDTFVLLPHLIAAKLSESDVSLDYGAEQLRFRRAPLSSGKQGAELVSWPPIAYERAKKRWYYSIIITFTVQTIPFQPYPVIYCEIGVRRWASPPIKELRRGNTSVYLLTSVPWIKGLHNSPSFSVAPLESFYTILQETQKQKTYTHTLQWGNSLTELIHDIQLQAHIPEPETLISDPEAFLNIEGKQAVTAAIVYRTGMRPDHGAKPGLMPGDRRDLFEKIAEFVSPTLIFTDAPKKVQYVFKRLSNPFFTKESFAERRRHIAQAIGDILTLEIWHQPDGIADTLVQTICDELGLTPLDSEASTSTWSTEELTITVQKHSLGALGEPLNLENRKWKRRERLHAAITDRIRDVEKQLAIVPSLGTHAAFIELADAQGFKGDDDPKYALRLGFASCGRITQFITPPGDERDDVENRARQAFLDLLRQAGVCLHLPQTLPLPKEAKQAGKSIEQVRTQQINRINYAAVWSIRQNASGSRTRKQQWLPVLVHISPEGQIRAISPGMSEWEPYSRALLAIASQQIKGGYSMTPQQMLAFIKEKIEEDIAPLGETLILCQVQNIRAIWPWINNNQIAHEGIAFGGASQSAITIQGLHIVRIRSGDSETPEYYAQKGTQVGFTRGLFRMGEQVFASTQSNPPQFKIRRNLSKAPRSSESAQAAATIAWNPGLYELTVITNAVNDAWQWAALTHELRQASLHYAEATALPFPLHLAKGIEEYAAPLSEKPIENAEENVEE